MDIQWCWGAFGRRWGGCGTPERCPASLKLCAWKAMTAQTAAPRLWTMTARMSRRAKTWVSPGTPTPPTPHPLRPPSLSESSWEQTRLKAKSSCGLWEEGWSISHHRDGAALWYGVQSRLNGTSRLNSMVSQGDSKLR